MSPGREGQVLLWRPLEARRRSLAVTTETRGPEAEREEPGPRVSMDGEAPTGDS